MRRGIAQLLQAAVTREPGRVADQAAEAGMVRVLVLDEARRQHDGRPDPPEDARQLDRVGGADFQMGIAVEFEELERRTEQRGGPLGLERPLGGRAVRRRLAARADDQVRRPAGAGLPRDDAAAAEFDVVGVRAEGQQRRTLRQGGSV